MAASGFASSSLLTACPSDNGFSRVFAYRSSFLPFPSSLRSFSFDPSPSSSSRFISLISVSPSRPLRRSAVLALDPDFYKIPYAEGIPVGSRMKIWNLPQNCDKEELTEWFQSINITVTKLEFTDDPELNAQGINGFVEMSTKHEACMAVAQLDGRKFKGRCIRFDFVEKRPHEREIGGRRNRPSYSSSSSSYPSSLVNDFQPTGRRGSSRANPNYATGTANRPGPVSSSSSYRPSTESRPSTSNTSSYTTSTASSMPSVAPRTDSPPSAPSSPPSNTPTPESRVGAPSSTPSYADTPSSSPSSTTSYAGAPSGSPSYASTPSSTPSYANAPSSGHSYASAPSSSPSYATAPSSATGYASSSDAPRSYVPQGYSRPYGGPSSKVFVGNLPWSVDEAGLERIFGVHGTIYEAKVMRDRESGRSRGFGFVLFSSPGEMQAAISALDGSYVEGRPIKVNEAASRY